MRGNLSYEGIGFRAVPFKAGAAIKALVAAANRDAVVGLPVVISGLQEVGFRNNWRYSIWLYRCL